MANRGHLHWFQKDVSLCVILWENEPTAHLIYVVSKHFHDEFMVSIAGCESFSTQHDDNFVNYGPS